MSVDEIAVELPYLVAGAEADGYRGVAEPASGAVFPPRWLSLGQKYVVGDRV